MHEATQAKTTEQKPKNRTMEHEATQAKITEQKPKNRTTEQGNAYSKASLDPPTPPFCLMTTPLCTVDYEQEGADHTEATASPEGGEGSKVTDDAMPLDESEDEADDFPPHPITKSCVLDAASILVYKLTARRAQLQEELTQITENTTDKYEPKTMAHMQREIQACEHEAAAITPIAGTATSSPAAAVSAKVDALRANRWNHKKHREDTVAELTETLKLLEEFEPHDGTEQQGLLRCVNPQGEVPTQMPAYMTTDGLLDLPAEESLTEPLAMSLTVDLSEITAEQQTCDYFQVRPEAEECTTPQSVTATVELEDLDGSCTPLTIVVDSGAAWTGIDAKTLERQLPLLAAEIRPTNQRFRDASKNLMPLLGEVQLAIKLGDLLMKTKAFVFTNLGAPLLLGASTLKEYTLTLDARTDMLISYCPRATTESMTRLSYTTRQPQVSQVSHVASEATTEEPQYSTTVRTTRRHTLRPGEGPTHVAMTYTKPLQGPIRVLEVTMGSPFLSKQANRHLQHYDSAQFSSMNYHSFVLIKNAGKDVVVIPRGTILGTAALAELPGKG